MDINWVLKSFDELTKIELYNILQLRSEVFIIEQKCFYQDVDGKDLKSLHLLAYDKNNLFAYSRLLPQNLAYKQASIGRVACTKDYRGNGIGKILMQKSITETFRNFNCSEIKIEAQLYLQKFYENLGFVKTSEPFLDAGILHIDMLLNNSL